MISRPMTADPIRQRAAIGVVSLAVVVLITSIGSLVAPHQSRMGQPALADDRASSNQ